MHPLVRRSSSNPHPRKPGTTLETKSSWSSTTSPTSAKAPKRAEWQSFTRSLRCLSVWQLSFSAPNGRVGLHFSSTSRPASTPAQTTASSTCSLESVSFSSPSSTYTKLLLGPKWEEFDESIWAKPFLVILSTDLQMNHYFDTKDNT